MGSGRVAHRARRFRVLRSRRRGAARARLRPWASANVSLASSSTRTTSSSTTPTPTCTRRVPASSSTLAVGCRWPLPVLRTASPAGRCRRGLGLRVAGLSVRLGRSGPSLRGRGRRALYRTLARGHRRVRRPHGRGRLAPLPHAAVRVRVVYAHQERSGRRPRADSWSETGAPVVPRLGVLPRFVALLIGLALARVLRATSLGRPSECWRRGASGRAADLDDLTPLAENGRVVLAFLIEALPSLEAAARTVPARPSAARRCSKRVARLGARSAVRRGEACRILGRLGQIDAIPMLVEHLRDRDPVVRREAIGALAALRAVDALPAIAVRSRGPTAGATCSRS